MAKEIIAIGNTGQQLVNKLANNFTELYNSVNGLEGNITKLDDEVAKLDGDLGGLNDNIIELDNTVTGLNTSVLELNRSVAELGSRMIEEAPVDDNPYARENADWTEIKSDAARDVVDTSYASLVSLKTTARLVPSQIYRITDYATKYRQPYTGIIRTSEVEPLFVQAISSSQISVIAYSAAYPQDIIYYDIDDNLCENGTTARTGFITRRIDTKYGNNEAGDWRTMVWTRFKATAISWAGGAVARLTHYQSGDDIYMALRAGTPTTITDTSFFQKICSVNDYYWNTNGGKTGLSINMSDYAARYTFNASLDMTLKTPTKSDTIFPEGNIGGMPSLKTTAQLFGLANVVYMFDTEANKPKSNVSAGFNHSSTIIGSNNSQGNNNFNSTIIGDGNSQNSYNQNSIIIGGYNSQGSGDYGSTIAGSYNSQNNYNHTTAISGSYNLQNSYNHTSTIIGDSNSQNSYNYGTTIIGSYNAQGNRDHASIIIGNGNSQNNYNNGFITGANFNYNNCDDNSVTSKDVSTITELHGKIYPHRITKNSTGAVYAIHHVGTTPTFTSIA